jgi:hypothetical protein
MISPTSLRSPQNQRRGDSGLDAMLTSPCKLQTILYGSGTSAIQLVYLFLRYTTIYYVFVEVSLL